MAEGSVYNINGRTTHNVTVKQQPEGGRTLPSGFFIPQFGLRRAHYAIAPSRILQVAG